MTRKRKPGEADEHDEQSAFFDLLAVHAPSRPVLELAYAIPNGGHRSKKTAGRLKAEGVKAGIPDVHLPVRSGCGAYIGLFLEFKRPWSTTTDRQKVRIRLLREAGHRVEVVETVEQAWRITSEHICRTQSQGYIRDALREIDHG